jgi:DNA-binding transcriptional ArsR family regulator
VAFGVRFAIRSKPEHRDVLKILECLADSTRLKMLRQLDQRDDLCVSEVAKKVGISVSATSQHFRIFEAAGLVHRIKVGQKVCYRLVVRSPLVAETLKMINNHS